MNTTRQKHPKGLYVLFFAEMWERFCYYGMRALLSLYLIKSLLLSEAVAFGIYGAYTALVYAAPVLGGKLADRILGYRNAVLLGAVFMAIGEFLILGGTEAWLYIGMGAIIIGNGYFKANISSIVGRLYHEDDHVGKDAGFTIFYIGINIGALLATTACAYVGEVYGFHYGFALAGIGMLIGLAIFYLGQKHYIEHALPPNPEKLYKRLFSAKIPFNNFTLIALSSIAAVPILYFLLKYNTLVGYLLVATGVYVIGSLIARGYREGKVLLQRIFALIILMFINIVFWACFEQAGTSLTLFADKHVDRHIWGWEMGAAMTQFFNPGFIILCGSLFSAMWLKLSRIGKNPNIPTKFALGLLQLGAGYLMILLAPAFFGSSVGVTSLVIIVLLYLLHTTGELFLSPIGLSVVTKLVPKDMTGTAMGAWFLSLSASNYVAGLLAKLTGGEEGTANENLSIAESFDGYYETYSTMGFVAIGVAFLLLLLNKPFNRLFHGIT